MESAVEDVQGIPEAVTETPSGAGDASSSKKKRERKPQESVAREPGKSLFPVSRVQKIIKADKDIPIVAKEATFLIALATEEFIKRLCESASQVAQRNNRLTVQHKDVATIVRKADEFLFLEDIIPWSMPEAPAPKKTKKDVVETGQGLLDTHFTTVKTSGAPEDGKEETLEDRRDSDVEDEDEADGGDEDVDEGDGEDDVDEDGDIMMFEDGTMGTG